MAMVDLFREFEFEEINIGLIQKFPDGFKIQEGAMKSSQRENSSMVSKL